jgi:hypothetical protein
MHNCKNAKEALMEAALQGWIPIPGEFAACPLCREEFDSLRGTLQMTDAALQLAQPRENFWVGYDARLRRRLINNEQPASRSRLRGFASVLRLVATASVPVPAPLALALFGFLVFSTFLLMHSRTNSNGAPSATPPTVITKTIEVPVIQEKLVTRIVYRDQSAARPTAPAALARNTTVATRREEAPATESLDGFKPVPEAKLTLIKGNRDEK